MGGRASRCAGAVRARPRLELPRTGRSAGAHCQAARGARRAARRPRHAGERELCRHGGLDARHRRARCLGGAGQPAPERARNRQHPRTQRRAPRAVHDEHFGRGRGACGSAWRNAARPRHPGRGEHFTLQSRLQARTRLGRSCRAGRCADLYHRHHRQSQRRDADASQPAVHRGRFGEIARIGPRRPGVRRAADFARVRPGVGMSQHIAVGSMFASRGALYGAGDGGGARRRRHQRDAGCACHVRQIAGAVADPWRAVRCTGPALHLRRRIAARPGAEAGGGNRFGPHIEQRLRAHRGRAHHHADAPR